MVPRYAELSNRQEQIDQRLFVLESIPEKDSDQSEKQLLGCIGMDPSEVSYSLANVEKIDEMFNRSLNETKSEQSLIENTEIKKADKDNFLGATKALDDL